MNSYHLRRCKVTEHKNLYKHSYKIVSHEQFSNIVTLFAQNNVGKLPNIEPLLETEPNQKEQEQDEYLIESYLVRASCSVHANINIVNWWLGRPTRFIFTINAAKTRICLDL